jgi:hypothetical protein
MSIVTIKEVQNLVSCAENGVAEHVFSVKNSLAESLEIKAQLIADPPTELDWMEVADAGIRKLEQNTVTQFTVKVLVPKDCAAGKYSYRLRIYDPSAPGEKFTEGDKVYFEVPERKVIETPAPPPKRKWWIPVTIALLVLIGVVVLILTTT